MGLFKDCGCGCNGKKQEKKLFISLLSALVFFVIANPDTFRLMRSILGSWVSGPNGCPTTAGLILHTIVFALITWGMMNIKTESYMGPGPVLQNGPSSGEEEEEEEEEEPQPQAQECSPRMADMPDPLPDMTETTYDMSDTGKDYEPMDVNSDMDLPAPYTPV
jgi:hypothetical protein